MIKINSNIQYTKFGRVIFIYMHLNQPVRIYNITALRQQDMIVASRNKLEQELGLGT